MVVSIDKIQKGVTQFIDSEIAPNLSGWEKIGFCAAAALIIRNIPQVFDKLRGNTFVQMLGVIDQAGNVDIDALRDAVAANLKEEHIDIPVVKMRLKVTQADLNTLYNMIKEA